VPNAVAAIGIITCIPPSFILLPSISVNSEPFGHVTALLESCHSTHTSSGAASASFHHLAQSTLSASVEEVDSFSPSIYPNSDAKLVHSLHNQQPQQPQQQQQERTHHSIMHSEFASSLLSRPIRQTPDATADKVAQASTRALPSFNPAVPPRRELNNSHHIVFLNRVCRLPP
jgi:hypothetical protein